MDELAEFVRAQGLVVVLPVDQPDLVVRARFDSVPADDALRQVADQLDGEAVVIRRGPRLYVVGEPSDVDMVARVYNVTGQEAEDFREIATVLGTKRAEVATVGDTLVVRDTIDGMRTIETLFDTVGSARGQYLVEVYFVEVTNDFARDLGIEGTISGNIQLQAGVGGLAPADILFAFLNYEGGAIARENDRHLQVVTSTRLHVIEGEDAEFQVGETTPVPQRTVTDAGTVTTTDFEEVDTGVLLLVGVRSEPDGRLRLILEPEISEITGDVDGAPIRSRRRLRTAAVIEPGGVVLVGGFRRQRDLSQRSGLPHHLHSPLLARTDTEEQDTRLYILARVYDPTRPFYEPDAPEGGHTLPAGGPTESGPEAVHPLTTTVSEALNMIELAAIDTHLLESRD